MAKGTASLGEVYELMLGRYGPQHWWPADSWFEMMVGAVLTQSAAWTNVEKAIGNLSEKAWSRSSLSASASR